MVENLNMPPLFDDMQSNQRANFYSSQPKSLDLKFKIKLYETAFQYDARKPN